MILSWFRYYKRCSGFARAAIEVMGYSVRTAEWRYTEWFKYDGVANATDMNSTVAASCGWLTRGAAGLSLGGGSGDARFVANLCRGACGGRPGCPMVTCTPSL